MKVLIAFGAILLYLLIGTLIVVFVHMKFDVLDFNLDDPDAMDYLYMAVFGLMWPFLVLVGILCSILIGIGQIVSGFVKTIHYNYNKEGSIDEDSESR